MTSSTLSLVEVASQRVHPLRDRVRIGRGTDADIRLDDPMVALAHAELIGHGVKGVVNFAPKILKVPKEARDVQLINDCIGTSLRTTATRAALLSIRPC